jgi:hypothetical protein
MLLIGAFASVGMLAKEAERFGSGEDRDGGSSGAPEPKSQRKRLRTCAHESRDERERRKATSEGRKGAVADRSERWSRRRCLRFAFRSWGCSVELATRDWRNG